nr:hypothetical protein [Chromobacterium haemolyticum]
MSQWFFSEPLSCLGQSAFGNVGVSLVGQHQIEMGSDFRDGLMPEPSQRDQKPDDLLGRQFTPSHAGFAGHCKGVDDPLRINFLRKGREIRVFVSLANHRDGNE